MKYLITIAAVACTIFANAAVYSLSKGINHLPPRGQLVAAQAVTVAADQAVTIYQVASVTDCTNAWNTVDAFHDRYDFAVTNYDGNAAFATNVVDSFSYAAFATNVRWIASVDTSTTPWTTNWVSRSTRIVGSVDLSRTNIPVQVAAPRLPSATYYVTNSLLVITADGHFASGKPDSDTFILDGDLLLSTGDEDDRVTIQLKD